MRPERRCSDIKKDFRKEVFFSTDTTAAGNEFHYMNHRN